MHTVTGAYSGPVTLIESSVLEFPPAGVRVARGHELNWTHVIHKLEQVSIGMKGDMFLKGVT